MNKRWQRDGDGGAAPHSWPHIPISFFDRQSWLNVQMKRCLGTMQVFCGSWCPPFLQEKSWFHQYLLMFSRRTVLGWLRLVLQYAAKKLISKSESLLQKQHRHPPSPLDTSVFKLMLIVSFWSRVACLAFMDQLLAVLKNPLAAWHKLRCFFQVFTASKQTKNRN